MKLHLLFLLCWPVAAIFGADIYVDDDPSSLNSGTLAEPYTSIQTALNVAMPGDIIYVRSGTYNEKVSWTTSGTSGNPITLRNFLGETPIMTGTGISSPISMITISSKSYIIIDGIQMRDNYVQDAKGIYVLGEGSDITITNCTITEIGFTSNKSTDPTSVSPTGQAHGILVNGRTAVGYSNINIVNNELSCLVTGNSESLTLVGNNQNFLIDQNTIHDNTNIGIDVAGHYTWAIEGGVDESLNQSRDGTISNNTVYDNRRFSNTDAPAGIYVDGGKDVIIEGNTVYSNGNGLSVGCENAGKTASGVQLRNNLVYNNDNHGIVFGSNASTIDNCHLRNNTFFKNGSIQNFTSEVSLQNSTNCSIENNILYSRSISHYSIGIFAYTASSLSVNNNLTFREGGDLSNLIVAGNGSSLPSDVNTVSADPLLSSTNLSSPDLHLQTSSPAINAGLNTNVSLNEKDIDQEDRILNATVDIGADERDNNLPILLQHPLKAIRHLKGIELLWQTSAEINFSHFEIEKSNNLQTWFIIGQLNGGKYYYRFLDESINEGAVYYRLKAVDIDQGFSYSNVASITITDTDNINVYPNPSNGLFTINGNFSNWIIYSADGKKLQDGNSKNLIIAEKGTFLIKIIQRGDKIQTKRVVVR